MAALMCFNFLISIKKKFIFFWSIMGKLTFRTSSSRDYMCSWPNSSDCDEPCNRKNFYM